jgi:hypothetical protein
LLAAGFLVGSLPAWLFYLTQPDPLPGSPGSARRFLESNIDLSWGHVWEYLTRAVPLVVGTYYWVPATPFRFAALLLCGSLYVTAVALAGAEAVRALRGEAPTRRGWGVTLLLLTLVATYAALYGSRFNILDDHSRGRYLLPAYIPLFLFLGAAIAWLARRSRLAAGAVLTFVVAFQLWTNVEFLWPLHPDKQAWRAGQIATREALARRLRAVDADAVLVDDGRSSFLWQFLLDRPVVSDLGSDNYYPSAVRADAAARVAILATPGDGDMSSQLTALGATATAIDFGRQRLHEGVRVPRRAYRLVPRTGWRSLGESDLPPSVADGDLGTEWPARRLDRSEAGELVLDLGDRRVLARLVLWPTALTGLIVPLEISGSLDAITWERLGVAPDRVARPAFIAEGRPVFRQRNGWLELATPPEPVRYLRVRPAEPGAIGAGMVGELHAYEALERPPAEAVDVGALVRVLRARGVTRLLADPVVSARVLLATKGAVATLPANGALNSHGVSPPRRLYARLRFRETDAALVPAEDAGDLLARLESAGLPVTSEPIGPSVLVQPAGPLPRSARCQPTEWRVTAEVPEAAGRGTRYAVEGRLTEPTRLAAIRLEHPPVSTRHVAILRVGLSDDGRTWRALDGARRLTEWAWAGLTLFAMSGGASELAMGGQAARAVRVEVRMPYRGAAAITALCVRAQT